MKKYKVRGNYTISFEMDVQQVLELLERMEW